MVTEKGSLFVPWAIFLGVSCLDEAGVPRLQVDITRPVLGPVPGKKIIPGVQLLVENTNAAEWRRGLTSIYFGSFSETQHLFSASGKIHLVSVRNKERYAKTSSYKYFLGSRIFHSNRPFPRQQGG